MGTARSVTARVALVASAALLIAGLSAAGVAQAKPAPRVVLRLTLVKKIGAIHIGGTYIASGGITDRGTFAGTELPVYGKVPGVIAPQVDAVAYDWVMMQKGTRGSFVLRCRDTQFNLDKDGNLKTTLGRCVLAEATGAYARLQPVGPTTTVASFPDGVHIKIVRFVTARTRHS